MPGNRFLQRTQGSQSAAYPDLREAGRSHQHVDRGLQSIADFHRLYKNQALDQMISWGQTCVLTFAYLENLQPSLRVCAKIILHF